MTIGALLVEGEGVGGNNIWLVAWTVTSLNFVSGRLFRVVWRLTLTVA